MEDTRYNPFPSDVVVPLCPASEAEAAGATEQDLRAQLAERFGVSSDGVFLLDSGTSALWLAIAAYIAGRDAEVAIPTFACTALLTACRMAKAAHVFTDVETDRFVTGAKAVMAPSRSRQRLAV